MAITVTNMGTGGNNTASTTLALSPTGTFTYYSYAILCLSYDNAGTQGADPFSSIADSIGANTWNLLYSLNNDPGAASAGISTRVYYSYQSNELANTLSTTDTITVTFSTSVTAKTYSLYSFDDFAYTLGFNTLRYGSQTGNGTTPSATITNAVDSSAYLGIYGAEGNATITADSDTDNGSWTNNQSTTVGTGTSGVQILTQVKITSGISSSTVSRIQSTTASKVYNTTNTLSNTITGVAAGNNLVVLWGCGDKTGSVSNFSISSSPALTWTLLAQPPTGNSSSDCRVYISSTTSAGSYTVTTGYNNPSGASSISFVVAEYNGIVTPGTWNTATAVNQTAPSLSFTNTQTFSYTVGSIADWNAISGASRTYRSTVNELFYSYLVSDMTGYFFDYLNTSATSITYGLSAPTGQSSGIALVELPHAPAPSITYNVSLSTAQDYAIGVIEVVLLEAPKPPPPSVTANTSATVLSVTGTTATLNGSASSGTITSYSWTRISGPNTPTITNIGSPAYSATASGLVVGSYVFRLTVNGSGGLTSSADVTITVSASGSGQDIADPLGRLGIYGI